VFGIIFWIFTNDLLIAVVIVTLGDIVSFILTFRKVYAKLRDEGIFVYFLSSIKLVFGIAALGNLSLITTLYPVLLVITNGVFIIMLFARRKIVRK
jgi:hypothetical protein